MMECIRGLVSQISGIFARFKSNCCICAKSLCCSSQVENPSNENNSIEVFDIEFALSSVGRKCDSCKKTTKRYHNYLESPNWMLLCIQCGIVYLETFPEKYKKEEQHTIL